ncbi:IS1096 element passenger TnpR family protein [Rhodocaloribacter sp.]
MAAKSYPGTCRLCGNVYDRRNLTRHLKTCIPKHLDRLQSSRKHARPAPAFHLFVDGYGPYFLHLMVSGKATLGDLDAFLRDIWLECCGHLSAFTIEAERYSSFPIDEGFFGLRERERDMDVRLADVLAPNLSFSHEYDFGSTTELELRVVSAYEHVSPKEAIQILVRNEKPSIWCGACGKAEAVMICPLCAWDEESWLCERCAPRHACGKEVLLPVINSPRTGVCGYEGPLVP